MPSIVRSRSPRTSSMRGSESSRPQAYGIRGFSNSVSTVPVSTIRPAYMTLTRSHIPAAIPRSWVIIRTAVPNSDDSRWMSSRIWAWIVTSRAVVGSSARISFGSHDSAMAIITRWRMPPENWNG